MKIYLQHCAFAAAAAAAFAIGTASAASAAPRWSQGAAFDTYGYYDYAPGAAVGGSESTYPAPYHRQPYYLVTPAFRPGCGAGKPHCS